MTEKKREGFAPPALGGSSLLVVFAVLALTVFALLSLSTVRADVRLGDATEKMVSSYYAADVKAQEILAKLRTGAPLPEDVEFEATISDYPDHSETIFSYSIPISDTQELQVEVLVEPDGSYQVRRWQAAAVGDWTFDDSLDLWDGDILF
ncbi:MAG: hypothetical protein HFF43_01310 [Lawsonibacter sp.]|jgi:hypothetical protein|nr:hypothetical protein [Lawsonibacter sp.]